MLPSVLVKGQQALDLLEVRQQVEAASVLPNVISCSAVISACGTGQHWQQALVTLTMMLQAAVLPSVISCSALTAVINASEKGPQWHHALDLLASMQQTAARRNVISSSAVSLLVRSVSHGSLASLGIEAASSVLPNVISCSAVISACGIG